MTLHPLRLTGAAVLETQLFRDERGFFTERFREDEWRRLIPDHPGFIQENFSFSKMGVVRGLHFQHNPAQGKLVTCVQGAIYDVLVDIRRDSPTFGQYLGLHLTQDEPRWVWIPAGFAHGFQVTDPRGAGLLYKVDAAYAPAGEGSIRFDDPELAIKWPASAHTLSDKDATAPSFAAFRDGPIRL